MKVLSPETMAMLQEPVIRLAAIITLVLRGGQVLRMTDHDEPITRGGQTWRPLCGLRRTATSISAGLDVNGQDLSGYFEGGGITADLIDAGELDGATAFTDLVDVRAPDAYDLIPLLPGRVADIETERDTFTLQLNDDAELLQQQFGEVTSPDCRANLGDARCKKTLAAFTMTGAVTSVIDGRTYGVSIVQPAGFFDYGEATFTSGENAGLRFEIRTSTPGRLSLFLPTWLPVAAGAGIRLVAGCDKTRATCRTRFGNVINFRGEPDLPGVTALTTSASDRL